MQLFQDKNGQWSMTRALTAFVTVVMVLTWAGTCVKTGTFVEFGASNAAVLGSLIGAKALQRFGEK